jgi:hypothetical protein
MGMLMRGNTDARMGKLVRRGRRTLTGEIVTAHGPIRPRTATVARGTVFL